MKLTDYGISYWERVRHIVLRGKTLCKHKTHLTLQGNLESNPYGIRLIDLCSVCISKLPKDVGEEIKFNYIVRKLKNDI